MKDKLWFLVRVSRKVPNTRRTLSLGSNFFTGPKIKPKKCASSNRHNTVTEVGIIKDS